MCILQSLCVYYNLYVYTTISMLPDLQSNNAMDEKIFLACCSQCDQIWLFLKALIDKLSYKSSQNVW